MNKVNNKIDILDNNYIINSRKNTILSSNEKFTNLELYKIRKYSKINQLENN